MGTWHKGGRSICSRKFIQHPDGSGSAVAELIPNTPFVRVHVEGHAHASMGWHIPSIDHAGAYIGSHDHFNDFQHLWMSVKTPEHFPFVGKVCQTPYARLNVILFSGVISFQ